MEDASFSFGGSYIMALDCGTTSVLATIVDEYGCIVAQARRSVKTSFPRPGWVEQDPTGGACQSDRRDDGGPV